MSRKVQHSLLTKAKINKKDEFYTQRCDIERELTFYKDHFKDKVVYCNCDDARISNFCKYFVDNFEKLGLKKLIVSCYKKQSMDLFENNKSSEKAFYIEYEGQKDNNKLDYNNLDKKFFKSDGDFRNSECVKLLNDSDVVVTNPPFSLFREYIAQIIKYNKKFLVIGNINAITYKEIFKLIKNNEAWMGINMGRGISGFIVPESYELYGTETREEENGVKIISPNNCLWLTNLDMIKRHEDIDLTKQYYGNEEDFPKYDNYDGINVNKTKDIPKDYPGHIGVPITFLHKFNPDQFEIIKFRKGDNGKDLCINGKCPYFRILVRNKRLEESLTIAV